MATQTRHWKQKTTLFGLLCALLLAYPSATQGGTTGGVSVDKATDHIKTLADLEDLTTAQRLYGAFLDAVASIPEDEQQEMFFKVDRSARQVEWNTVAYTYDNGRVCKDLRDPSQKHLPFYFREMLVGNGGNVDGGICPTFIQPPAGGTSYRPVTADSNQDLFGAIAIPTNGCLLRSDIPIYGIAGGSEFKEYRVEFGEGDNPNHWRLINGSNEAQPFFSRSEAPELLQGDLDLRGNLATWNVGLRNWEHLPWHAETDTFDLCGRYTIRLSVLGRDGQRCEDRITVDVSGVIAQCLPGAVHSPDHKARLTFEEQSLSYPFRVYSVQPISTSQLERRGGIAGSVYEIKPAGDQFIKPVTLSIAVAPDMAESVDLAVYEPEADDWLRLTTEYDLESGLLAGPLLEFPAGEALVGLVPVAEGSWPRRRPAADTKTATDSESRITDEFVCRESFTEGSGAWTGRDRHIGGTVLWLAEAGPDGSPCIRLMPAAIRGTMACDVWTSPFDAAVHGLMSFDYRLHPTTRLDLLLLVSGRWYAIGLTDDPNDYQYTDVNIANLASVDGIHADETWHHTTIDLHHLLRAKTRQTQVDRVILANWDIGGFMDLRFGANSLLSYAEFDNVHIVQSPGNDRQLASVEAPLLIEDFVNDDMTNLLGGGRRTFANPGGFRCQAALTSGDQLAIRFDVSHPGDFSGWWTAVEGWDLSNMSSLYLSVDSGREVPACLVGLKDRDGRESKVPLRAYISSARKAERSQAMIPLRAFGPIDRANLVNLSISFEYDLGQPRGMLSLDEISVVSEEPVVMLVADFDDPSSTLNALGGDFWTFQNGAAAIGTGQHFGSTPTGSGSCLRISYGGTIGLDLGPRNGFSFAGWSTRLGGVDISQYSDLRFDLRGQAGGEQFNLYLSDGNCRRLVSVATGEHREQLWHECRIQLGDFTRKGLDLTNVDELQIVFEWENRSGTVYIDNIRFERPALEQNVTTR